MKRSQIVLAGMAAGGREARFDPVQAQKCFFLLDREVPDLVDGPHFDFEPYHYGPFDKAVYEELGALAVRGEVRIDRRKRYCLYLLTDSGYAKGSEILNRLPEPVSRYLTEAARWVLSLTFRQLLSEIYRHYPDMAINSIVRRSALDRPCISFLFPVPSFVSGMARTFDFMGTFAECWPDIDGERLDAMAIHNDWQAVGEDIEAAMQQLRVSGGTS